MESDMILLFSGGVDSFIAFHYLNHPKTIYFDIKSEYSKQEIKVVKALAPFTIIDESLNLSEHQTCDANAFIPMRNLYFAMLASQYSDNICIAGVKDDCVNDKNEEIFEEFSDIISRLTGRKVTVFSPFWWMTKADLVKWFIDANQRSGLETTAIPEVQDLINVSISCYTPKDGKACNACPSCFRKWVACWVNGIKLDFNNDQILDQYYARALVKHYNDQRNSNIIKAIDGYRSIVVTKTYAIDIDGVLTNETEGHNYSDRTPNKTIINKVNRLFNAGNKILLFSSRYEEDMATTINWLALNDVKYTNIQLGKPQYDIIIDDKALNVIDF